MLRKEFNNAEKKLEKFKQIKKFSSFLKSTCQDKLCGETKDILENLNIDDQSTCSRIIAPDENIDSLLNLDIVFTLQSNIFYCHCVKQFLDKNKTFANLIDFITNIKLQARERYNFPILMAMKIMEFDQEFIQPAIILIGEQEKSKLIDSNIIYQKIESDYLDFKDLSNDDKIFLHNAVVKINHFDDFINLKSFLDKTLIFI